jgi:glycosyltransferase involved in cell wall biosynthesis
MIGNGPAATPTILHVTAPSLVGGASRVVHMLAAGHRARGLDVHVAAITDNALDASQFFEPLRAKGIGCHTIVAPSRAYFGERRALRALCAEVRPGVVHTHGYRADVLSGSAARGLGLATVSTVHGFTGGDLKNRFYEWLQVRSFRQFEAVVAVSRPLAKLLADRGVLPRRLHTLVNAWPRDLVPLDRAAARQALGLPLDATIIGWTGRLSREKGPDIALRAFGMLRADQGAILSFVGDGPERLPLQRQAVADGIDGEVRWHGIVRDAGRLMLAFDVLVLSSHTEGTPIVLFEAMDAGVPIVATHVGGVPDVVTNEEALLVPPADPVALAGAIRRVLSEAGGRDARVTAARRRLHAHFAPEPWLSAYESIYRSVSR